MHASSLISVGLALGISREQFIPRETPDRLYLEHRQNPQMLRDLSAELIDKLFDDFGDSIQISIGLLGGLQEITIDGKSQSAVTLSQISALIIDTGSSELVTTITLDKGKLIAYVSTLRTARAKYIYFLFLENLEKFLSESDTVRLCDVLFADPTIPTILVLGEKNIAFSGKYLGIVSVDAMQHHEFPNPTLDDTRDSLSLNHLTQSSIRWIGFSVRFVTPIYFALNLSTVHPTAPRLADLLFSHFTTLFVLYTANVLVFANRHFDATFASATGDGMTKLEVGEIHSYNDQAFHDMLEVLNWLVGKNNEEKLRYFQTVVAKSFEENVSLPQLLERIGKTYRDAKNYFLLSIDGKVTKNFDGVQAVSRYVAQTSAEIGSAVDNLTRGLNDAVIAAIGIVIGGLITALSGGRTTGNIFTVLMFAYVIYIVIFQLVFRMLVLWNSYKILSESANNQIEEYQNSLGKERTDRLTRSLVKRQNQFQISFWSTVTILLILAIVFFFLALRGPELFAIQTDNLSPLPTVNSVNSTQMPTLDGTLSNGTVTAPTVAPTVTP